MTLELGISTQPNQRKQSSESVTFWTSGTKTAHQFQLTDEKLKRTQLTNLTIKWQPKWKNALHYVSKFSD